MQQKSSGMEGSAPVAVCRICGAPAPDARITVREMMFGTRDEFAYFECSACGCVQIDPIPADLGRYYRQEYHSFAEPASDGRVKRFLKRKRTQQLFGGKSWLGSLLLRGKGAPRFAGWLLEAGVGPEDPILDVGCGAGHLLRQMRDAGFSNLTGIDPYIRGDEDLGGGLRLLRRTLEDVPDAFRLVMLHHSFEHMPDPERALREVQRLLGPDGVALIRIPVAGSLAWRSYGTDWVQLDAPRHLHLHTARSMQILASRTGLELTNVVYDSNAFQFWGSEQYRRDIPLMAPDSYAVAPERSIFSPAEIEQFERRAAELNRSGEADSAAFYLRRPRSG